MRLQNIYVGIANMSGGKDSIANYYCENCDKWYKCKFDMTSELLDIVCPDCGGNDIWFGDIDTGYKTEIVMGRGGCKQK